MRIIDPPFSYLADTNIVFRRVLVEDPLHGLVTSAVDTLIGQGNVIHSCPQNLIEFHDFRRFAEITVVEPQAIVSPAP